jgi:hypothetical protein
MTDLKLGDLYYWPFNSNILKTTSQNASVDNANLKEKQVHLKNKS